MLSLALERPILGLKVATVARDVARLVRPSATFRDFACDIARLYQNHC
jgi:hypothetical protein